jgi:predicted phage tail protein
MSDNSMKLIRMPNPFDPSKREISELAWQQGKALADYFPVTAVNLHKPVISLNGKIVEESEMPLTFPRAGDSIVVCEVPADSGGDDDKSVLRIAAMIALIIVTDGAASGLVADGALTGTEAMVFSAGMMVAGSMVINALMPIPRAKQKGGGDNKLDDSPTYSANGATNTSMEGLPVPVTYGQFRTAGNIVANYIENVGNTQILYVLLNAGEGPIAGITGIELNEQPITNFKNAAYEVRLGLPDQPVIPWFNNTIVPHVVNTTLTTDWTTYRTSTQVDKLRIDVALPFGLFGVFNRFGNMTAEFVHVEMEYRKVGDSVWTPFGDQFLDHYDMQDYDSNGNPTTFFFDPDITFSTDGINLNAQFQPSQNSNPGFTGTYLAPDGSVVGTRQAIPVYKTGIDIRDMTRSLIRRSANSAQLPRGIYDIRVRRTTTQFSESNMPGFYAAAEDTTVLALVNEIDLVPVAYNNTALLGIRIQLDDQLSSFPRITYLNSGRLIKVWNPATQLWEVKQSANPAWCALDVLTNKRYGGGAAESRVNMQTLKDFAAFCTANNLQFNGVFDQGMNIWDALQVILRCGRGQIVPIGTRYSFIWEGPTQPTMMFSVANMVKGSFKNTWLGMADRANEIEINFFDKTDNYKQHTIRVADPSAIAAGKPQKLANFTLFGIVDADRAIKEGVLQLNLNRYILQTVEFQAPIEAIGCTVGDLIYVQHDMPQWGFAGRIGAGSSTTVINLDRPVTMNTDTAYKILIVYDAIQRASGNVLSISGNGLVLSSFNGRTDIKRLKIGTKDLEVLQVYDAGGGNHGVIVDDATGITVGNAYTLWDTDVLEEHDVLNGVLADGTQVTSVTVNSPFGSAPAQFQHWMFGAVNKVKKPFRVRAIQGSHDYARTITALEYNESVYDLNAATVIPVPNYSDEPVGTKQAVIDGVTEELFFSGTVIRTRAWVHFHSDQQSYRRSLVYASKNGGPFTELSTGIDRSYIEADDGDTITFKVVAVSVLGVEAGDSNAPTITHVVIGKTANPGPVQNFTIIKRPSDLLLTWDPSEELDVVGYDVRMGSSWDSGEIIVEDFSGTMHVDRRTTAGTYHYMIRAVDSGGRLSDEIVEYDLVLTPPVAVQNFVAVQTQNRVDMQWDPNPEDDIVGYEIREGAIFANAAVLNQVTATKFTTLAGTTRARTFWIVAIRAPGIYGDVPEFSNTQVLTPPTRNIVYEKDEGAANFPSTAHGFDMTIPSTPTMLSGVSEAEYLFTANLSGTFTAQNFLSAAYTAILDDTLTWLGADFPWDSDLSDRPWESLGSMSNFNITNYISKHTGALRTGELYGWTLDGTLVGEGGLNPDDSGSIVYRQGRYAQGLYLNGSTVATWPVSIPANFSMFLWVRPHTIGADGTFLRLTNDPLNTNLDVGYSAAAGGFFYMVDQAGNQVTLPMSVDTADEAFLVGIDINGTSRKLFAGKLNETASQASGTFTNMGAWTEMGLTSSLTWQAALFDWNSVDANVAWQDLPPGAGDVVMSDILVFSTHPTLADFQAFLDGGHAPGYEDFTVFINGDWTYDKAIFRIKIDALASDRVELNALDLIVDVPDLGQKGEVVVDAGHAAAGLAVVFPQSFHVVPNIQLTLKGGTTPGTPIYLSPTVNGFTLKILDSTNTGIAGTVAWRADAY